MAGHCKKSNLKCQSRIDDASIVMPIAEGMNAHMDDEGVQTDTQTLDAPPMTKTISKSLRS